MQASYDEQAQQALLERSPEKALLLWNKAIQDGASPNKIAAWISLLHATYYSTFSHNLAQIMYEHPEGNATDFLSTAKLFFQKARFDIATRLTERAAQLEPKNADILAMLASCLERDGHEQKAWDLLQEATQNHPEHARIVRLLAHIERRRKQFEAARKRLIHHLQQYPSKDDWRLQYELASILDRRSEYPAAMKALTAAKKQIASQIPRTEADQLSQRQWEVTERVNPSCISRWQTTIPSLTPPINICLMAGFPRSGTTLLEKILNSHPQCIGTDESGILATQFRNPLTIEANSAEDALEELDSFNSEDISAGRAEYLRCTEDTIGESLGNRWLIEKEPLLTADLAVSLRLFPDGKILMPIRDPRDVVISYFFTIVPLNPSSAAAENIEMTCRFYAQVMRHWLHFKNILPEGQYMESRYEDLIANPEIQTKRLASFLGIEWSENMLNHHNTGNDRAVSTPTYNDVSKPLYTRSIARWKNYEQYLTPHLHYLEPYLDAFGYS